MMLALALALSAAVAGAGSAPELKARTDVESVALGGSFHVFIDVLHRNEVAVNLPASVPLGDAFIVEDRATTATDHGDGTSTTHIDLTVVAFDVGELEVPAIVVTYVVEGTARELSTDPLTIRVDGVVGDGDQQLQPIVGPVQITRPDWTLIYVLGGLGALAALIAIVWLARSARRHKKVVAAEQAEALVPADEEALARLVELEGSGALDAEDLEPAYTSLSEIVRAYIGRRYGFPALDLTTEEINNHLVAVSEAAPITDELAELLEGCDFVKFAEYPSNPDEARAVLYQARRLVQRSAPSAAVASVASEPAVEQEASGA